MSEHTCWSLIQDAASGDGAAREEFTRRYLPVIRAYLLARWKAGANLRDTEDAVQEVFVECLREGGILERARPERRSGFRAFLFGAVRNVARRFEERRGRRLDEPRTDTFHAEDLAADEASLSHVFQRAWAESLLREAAEVQAERAREGDEKGLKRVELLRIRFQEGLPIREIARRWREDAKALHHEYARALRDYQEALREVVAFHHPGSPEEVHRECRELLGLVQ